MNLPSQAFAGMSINNLLRYVANSCIPGNKPIDDEEKKYIHDLVNAKKIEFFRELDNLFYTVTNAVCEGKSFKIRRTENSVEKLDEILSERKNIVLPKKVLDMIKGYNPKLVKNIRSFQGNLSKYKRIIQQKKPKIPGIIAQLLDYKNDLEIHTIDKVVTNVPVVIVKKRKTDESIAEKLAIRIVEDKNKREKGTHGKNIGYSVSGKDTQVRDIGGIAFVTPYGITNLDKRIRNFMLKSPIIQVFPNIDYREEGPGGYNAIHMDIKLNQTRGKEFDYESEDTVEIQIYDVESFLVKEVPGTKISQALYKNQKETNIPEKDKPFIKVCSSEILSVLQYK